MKPKQVSWMDAISRADFLTMVHHEEVTGTDIDAYITKAIDDFIGPDITTVNVFRYDVQKRIRKEKKDFVIQNKGRINDALKAYLAKGNKSPIMTREEFFEEHRKLLFKPIMVGLPDERILDVEKVFEGELRRHMSGLNRIEDHLAFMERYLMEGYWKQASSPLPPPVSKLTEASPTPKPKNSRLPYTYDTVFRDQEKGRELVRMLRANGIVDEREEWDPGDISGIVILNEHLVDSGLVREGKSTTMGRILAARFSIEVKDSNWRKPRTNPQQHELYASLVKELKKK